jgi:CBS domain-containing protein
MDTTELQPISNFIKTLPPFDQLTDRLINQCCSALSVVYYSKNELLVHVDNNQPQLYIVRSGAFEVTTEKGALIDRISDGQFFGFSGMLSGEKVVNKVHILEDGLIYQLPLKIFNHLRASSQVFDHFFNQAFAKRLRHQGELKSSKINSSRIHSLISEKMISINSDSSIQNAASLMSEKRVSSLIIIDNNQLTGILTDRDLRNRVLAKGLTGDTLIKQVMTTNPVTIPKNALIFEAMLLMSEKNIHHLPVVENDLPISMLTSTDIMRSQSSQPLLLIGQIDRQNSIENIVNVSKQLPSLLQNLIAGEAKAQEIGRILTLVTDALTKRLIFIAQQQLGEAPMQFCWLAFGSQARQDQAAGADQDNALLLEQETDENSELYFQQLATIVCTGLDKCGFPYCPGDIMATTPKWRCSLAQWQTYFRDWISTPQPRALLNASIFFDMRPIYGQTALFEQLQNGVLQQTKNNDIFIAALTRNAVQRVAPLGFFKNFVIERDGSEVKGLDLKHKGLALINDIARIYALANGIKAVNSQQRLIALIGSAGLNQQDIHNLIDASEFIAHKRLMNQGLQYKQGSDLSNYLLPNNLSPLARHHLKDAFKVVHDSQAGIKLKFLRLF